MCVRSVRLASGAQGPSLVDEFKSEADRQRAEKDAIVRRRRTRRLIIAAAAVVAMLIVGVIVKFAVDRYRAGAALAEAKAHLVSLSPSELAEADVAVERALRLAPGDANARGMHALISGHAAFVSGKQADIEAARLAVEEAESADAGPFHLGISSALVDLADGDLVAAREHLQDLGEPPEGSPVAQHAAWLDALIATAEPYPRKAMEAALPAMEVAAEADPDWLIYQRTRDLLRFATGDPETVQAELAEARAAHPGDVGLAVDETLYHAMQHDNAGAVALTVDKLLAEPDALLAFDVARLYLARGLANVHRDELDAAVEDLTEAWGRAAAWDLYTRGQVIEKLRWLGKLEQARLLMAKLDGAPQTKLWEAGLQIPEGDAVRALETLAALPQDAPEVAHLQALALAEQRRFREARPWIDRARKYYPGRLDLEVAHLRAVAGLGEEGDAVAGLTELSDQHPAVPRVWTGLGEAQLAAARADENKDDDATPPAAAIAAFEQAVTREPRPAEAHLQLARAVTGDLHRDEKARAEVTADLEKAAELMPALPRYRQALADHYLYIGHDDDAVELMRTLSKEPAVRADTLLSLSKYLLETRRGELGPELKSEVETLLAKADKLSPAPRDVARERARLAVASGDAEAAAKAAAELSPLVEAHEKDIELRLVYIDTLLASGDADEARSQARLGIRRLGKDVNGRFYIKWANAEVARGKVRGGGRIARDGWKRVSEEAHLPNYVLLAAAERSIALYVRLGKADIARRTGRELTRTLPLHPDAWAMRAELELDSKMEDAGCDSAASGLKLEPTSHAIHAAMAHCHASQGRFSEAKTEYARAIELAKATAPDMVTGYARRAKGL